MSTYLQICKDVRAQAGISGDGPANVTGQAGIYADVVRWVDESYNEIQTLHENWNFLHAPFSFVLQAGFEEYTPTVENIRIAVESSFLIQYQNEKKERLIFIPYAKWRASYTFLEDKEDKPTRVTILPDGTFHFYPKPTLDYTIYFEGYRQPDIMVNSTDEPIFSTQYHELVKLGALKRYAEYYNAQEIVRSVTDTYRRLLSKMQFTELPHNSLVTPTLVPFA